jgi:hypothetical protein
VRIRPANAAGATPRLGRRRALAGARRPRSARRKSTAWAASPATSEISPGDTLHSRDPQARVLVDVLAALVGVVRDAQLGREEVGGDVGTELSHVRRAVPGEPRPARGWRRGKTKAPRRASARSAPRSTS